MNIVFVLVGIVAGLAGCALGLFLGLTTWPSLGLGWGAGILAVGAVAVMRARAMARPRAGDGALPPRDASLRDPR